MELRVAEGKGSPKRDVRSLRGKNHRTLRNNILESIAQVNGGSSAVVSRMNEDGVVRMKLLVRKQDLRQILELIKAGKNNSDHHPLSMEQRLNLSRGKHLSRANATKENRQYRCWTPALQSIPEEL